MKDAIVTYPTLRAVMPDELKGHLRLDASDEMPYLSQLLVAAEGYAEEYLGRKLLTQTWDLYIDDWADPIKLPYPPLQSITSVKYLDSNGVLQTLSTDIYEAGEVRQIGVVRRKYNQQWPTARGHEDAIVIRFVCGWTAPERVPGPIRRAILMHAAWNYRNRGDATPADYRATGETRRLGEGGMLSDGIDRAIKWSMHWWRIKEF
jgi:uncharacterized phiE125 gp8 family phage protein